MALLSVWFFASRNLQVVMNEAELIKLVSKHKVFAQVYAPSAEAALRAAEAAIMGGVKLIEIMLATPGSFRVISDLRRSYEQQLAVERGESDIVGVNRFADDAPPPVIPSPDYSALEKAQAARVVAARDNRDSAAAERALEDLRDGAATYRSRHGGIGTLGQAHLMPLIIDAVRARATVGEISDTLESEWGRYR